MKLREDPRAWRKFTMQFSALMVVLCAWLTWRGAMPSSAWWLPVIGWLLVALAAVIRPRWFRGFYRFGMTASAWMGERMGRIVLTIFFFVIMVPLGLILRMAGHDPLNLRKRTKGTSYWQPVSRAGKMDQMY